MFMSILLLLISTSTGLSLSKRDQEADEYKEVRFRSKLPGPVVSKFLIFSVEHEGSKSIDGLQMWTV